MTELFDIPFDVAIKHLTVWPCNALIIFLITDSLYSKKKTALIYALWAFKMILLGLPMLTGPITPAYFLGCYFFSIISVSALFVKISRGYWLKNLFLILTYGNFFLCMTLFTHGISYSLFEGSHAVHITLRTLALVAAVLLLRRVIEAFRRNSGRIVTGWNALSGMAAFYMFTLQAVAVQAAMDSVGVTRPFRWYEHAAYYYILLMVVVSYYAVFRLMRFFNDEGEKHAITLQKRLLESELAAQEESVENARRYRHDMLYHNRVLAAYLENGDLDGARQYLSEYETVIDHDMPLRYSEHTELNALLRLAVRRCRAAGVGASITCRIPKSIPLSGPEITTLFGNLLENACAAAEEAGGGTLVFSAEESGGMLRVEVRNPVKENVCFADDLPVSEKPGGGVGIPSMMRTLEAHGGVIRMKSENGEFLTQIMLPMGGDADKE